MVLSKSIFIIIYIYDFYLTLFLLIEYLSWNVKFYCNNCQVIVFVSDLIEEVFNLIIENKVCGKFKKSVPPSVDIYSIES